MSVARVQFTTAHKQQGQVAQGAESRAYWFLVARIFFLGERARTEPRTKNETPRWEECRSMLGSGEEMRNKACRSSQATQVSCPEAGPRS